MILYVLVCRKLSHGCIIIPTCLLSSVAVETRCHDEAQEKTPPPLHAGMALGFLSSYNTKTKMTINAENRSVSHLEGAQSQRGNMIVPANHATLDTSNLCMGKHHINRGIY